MNQFHYPLTQPGIISSEKPVTAQLVVQACVHLVARAEGCSARRGVHSGHVPTSDPSPVLTPSKKKKRKHKAKATSLDDRPAWNAMFNAPREPRCDTSVSLGGSTSHKVRPPKASSTVRKPPNTVTTGAASKVGQTRGTMGQGT